MSTSQQAENVVDFAAYRARRHRRLSYAAVDDAPYGAFMFAMPIMIPIVAWMPVWTSANVARGEGLSE
jgi:hypothetical protein